MDPKSGQRILYDSVRNIYWTRKFSLNNFFSSCFILIVYVSVLATLLNHLKVSEGDIT